MNYGYIRWDRRAVRIEKQQRQVENRVVKGRSVTILKTLSDMNYSIPHFVLLIKRRKESF